MPSQLRNQRLLSRESAPPQPRDHSLSASLSESVIRLISTCQRVEECLLTRANGITQPVDLRLLRPAINAYSAARSVPVSRLRSTCQPVDQDLSASLSPRASSELTQLPDLRPCLLVCSCVSCSCPSALPSAVASLNCQSLGQIQLRIHYLPHTINSARPLRFLRDDLN